MMATVNSRPAELLGDVVLRYNETCCHPAIVDYTSRNSHRPTSYGGAARDGWPARDAALLLAVHLFHVVLSLPLNSPIAHPNTAANYAIPFLAASATTLPTAADPPHLLGRRVSLPSVFPSWASPLPHPPLLIIVLRGGSFPLDGPRWVRLQPHLPPRLGVPPGPVPRARPEKLAAAHCAGELQFFGKYMALTNPKAFAAYLAPLHNKDWVVYAKRPFGDPNQALPFLPPSPTAAPSPPAVLSPPTTGVTSSWGVLALRPPRATPQGYHSLHTHSPPPSPDVSCPHTPPPSPPLASPPLTPPRQI